MKILLIQFLIQSVLLLKGCKYYHGKYFFNLQTLENSPVQGDYEVPFTFENQSMKLLLNFCTPTYDKCIDGQSDFAHILNLNNMDCIHLTSAGKNGAQQAQLIGGYERYIGLIYDAGISECRFGSNNYDFQLQMSCDDTRELGKPKFELLMDSLNNCRIRVWGHAAEACGQKIYDPLWSFIDNIQELLGIVMIIIGLISALFGFQLMHFIFFTTGYATIVIIVFFFLYLVVLPQSTQSYMGWVIWFCGSILGVLFGMLMERYGRVAIGFLGAWLGGVIGITFYIAFLHELSDPQILIAMTILPTATICVIFSIVKWQRMMIICTGICGSYFTIRGISLIAGSYPNEFKVHEMIKTGQLDAVMYNFISQFPWEVYLYLAGMFSLAIISIGFQIYRKSRDKEENELQRKNYMHI